MNEYKLIEELEKVADRYPYKVIGNLDSYSEYNMAWQDCMDIVLQVAESYVETVIEKLNEEGNKFSAKAVGADIKGDKLFKEICMFGATAFYESADIVKRGGRNDR